VLYIYGVESAHRLLARTAVGDLAPLHCTAVGKAYLACLSNDEVEIIARRAGLAAFTPYTITTIDDLLADLAHTRERGFSMDQQEHELRTYCIGAAIRDDSDRPIASCSLSGADPDILGARLAELASLIITCADDISRRMGYVAQRPSTVPVSAAGATNSLHIL
jgi:DNA-binding IclR family transcriptional regulator